MPLHTSPRCRVFVAASARAALLALARGGLLAAVVGRVAAAGGAFLCEEGLCYLSIYGYFELCWRAVLYVGEPQ